MADTIDFVGGDFYVSNGTDGNGTFTINDGNVCFGGTESELDILKKELKDFYQWLKQEAKEIEKEDPDSTYCVDAIIDKMEEMFPELSGSNEHGMPPLTEDDFNFDGDETLFGRVIGTPQRNQHSEEEAHATVEDYGGLNRII